MNHTHERWEYSIHERLNEWELERLGAEGWELVTVAVPSDNRQGYRFYFKRPIPPGTTSEMEKAMGRYNSSFGKTKP